MDSPHLHPTNNDDDDEEEDDIRTISSSCFNHQHNDRPSPLPSSPLVLGSHLPHHTRSDTTTPSFPSDPAAVHRGRHDVIQHHHHYNPSDVIGRHSQYGHQEEEEVEEEHQEGEEEVSDHDDDTTTTTLEYPVSMNSSYSHRDALSASGSYGADMSFVTNQTMASPLPTSAVERGAHRALDETSSVLGHSTVAHTIASSSQQTHHQYFFHSSFLQSRHSAGTTADSYAANANAIHQGEQPNIVPHSTSLPFKGTDLTSESMFLGMEYDTDYIKTTLKADSTPTKENESDWRLRVHRKRMLGCVVTLVALILVVAIGGVLCTFATTCPGLEPLSSRSSSSSSSSSSNTVEDQYDDTAAPTPSPSPLIRMKPTANSNIVTIPPTRRPVVSKTDPPTKPPASKFPTASPVKHEEEPTNDNQDNGTESSNENDTENSTGSTDNNDNEDTPENTDNNDPEPTAAPTKEPTNDVTEDNDDLPMRMPTAEPVTSSPNDKEPPMIDQDDDRSPVTDDTVVPTTAPTFLLFPNDDDDPMMNTEDNDDNNDDDRRIRIP